MKTPMVSSATSFQRLQTSLQSPMPRLPRSNVYSTRDPANPSASVHRKRFFTPSLTLKFLCAGCLNPGKENGQGTRTYADGEKYVGGFKDGNKNGQGTYIYANGNTYVGEFKDDERNGQGGFYAANGSIKQSGIWKDNEFFGAVAR